jgi:hypothetical protein
MSRVTMKHPAGSSAAGADLLTAGPRLLVLSMESARDFVSRAAATMPAMPSVATLRGQAMGTLGASDCGCEIPEQDCPPRCVCELHWEGSPGETFRASIRLRNTASVSRQFSIAAAPLSGVTTGALSMAPIALSLAAGASQFVTVLYHVPDGTPTGDASTEITITGAYEQCVKVRLSIQPEPTITCEVAQGDTPTRVRAMHWYRHWQCEEPCEPPRQQPGTHIPGKPVPTGRAPG